MKKNGQFLLVIYNKIFTQNLHKINDIYYTTSNFYCLFTYIEVSKIPNIIIALKDQAKLSYVVLYIVIK